MDKSWQLTSFLKLVARGVVGLLLPALFVSLTSCQAFSVEEKPSEESTPAATPSEETTTTPTPEKTEPGVLWTTETFTGDFFVSEDKIFVLFPTDGGAVIQALDIPTGEWFWQGELEWETQGWIAGADSETLYVARQDGRFYAVDVLNGELRWKVMLPPETERIIGTVAYDKNRVYVVGKSGWADYNVFAIGKRDGQVVWVRPDSILPGAVSDFKVKEGIISASGKTILIDADIGGDWGLQGVDPETGDVKWQIDGVSEYEISDNTVFAHSANVSTGGSSLVGIDIDSGEIVWQSETQDIGRILELSPNSVYAGTWSMDESRSALRIFDRQTGEGRSDRRSILSPALYFLGEVEGVTIISDTESGFTWAEDAVTGTVRWENDDLVLDELVGVSQNTLIGLNRRGFLFGVDFETGERKWRLEISASPFTCPIIFHDKIVYGSDDSLVVIDPETGTQALTISLPHYGGYLYPKKELLLISGYGFSAVQI